MKMIFYSHANKSHVDKKDFALSLILKVTIRKWPIFVKVWTQGMIHFSENQFPVGLLAQLFFREAKSLNPVQAWIFVSPFFSQLHK